MKLLNKLKSDRQELINNLNENIADLEKIAYEQQKEIDNLQHYKQAYEELKAEHLETIKAIKQDKTEAIKEFAERLHDIFVSKVQKYYCKVKEEHSFKFLEGYLFDDVLSNIDYVKKEMVGDNNA